MLGISQECEVRCSNLHQQHHPNLFTPCNWSHLSLICLMVVLDQHQHPFHIVAGLMIMTIEKTPRKNTYGQPCISSICVSTTLFSFLKINLYVYKIHSGHPLHLSLCYHFPIPNHTHLPLSSLPTLMSFLFCFHFSLWPTVFHNQYYLYGHGYESIHWSCINQQWINQWKQRFPLFIPHKTITNYNVEGPKGCLQFITEYLVSLTHTDTMKIIHRTISADCKDNVISLI